MTIDELVPTITEIKRLKEKLEAEGLKNFSTNWNNLNFAFNQLLSKVEEESKLQFIRPMVGRISAPFGEKRTNSKGQVYYHTGVDIADNPANLTPIFATSTGIVIRAEMYGTYGLCIDIRHNDELVSRYAHCSKLLVKRGDTVKGGQQIAIVGSTGHSTGPHLHFEIRKNDKPVNPMEFI